MAAAAAMVAARGVMRWLQRGSWRGVARNLNGWLQHLVSQQYGK